MAFKTKVTIKPKDGKAETVKKETSNFAGNTYMHRLSEKYLGITAKMRWDWKSEIVITER